MQAKYLRWAGSDPKRGPQHRAAQCGAHRL